MKRIVFLIAVALLAATTVSAQRYGNRYLKDRIQPPFAALSFADSSITQSLTEDTWSTITGFTADSSNLVTTSNDTIIIQESMGYEVSALLNYSGTANDTAQVSLFKNSSASGPKMQTAGALIQTVNLTHYLTLDAGDTVTVCIRNISDDDDVTVYSGGLFLKRIYK